jgi:PDZ domain-containing protein
VTARRRSLLRTSLLSLGVALCLILVVNWLVPSSTYMLVPVDARPTNEKVRVPGEKPQHGRGAVYYVAVSERQATWAQRLIPALRPDGADLVEEQQLIPDGSSFDEEVQQGRAEMARSEEIATAVALRAAGYKIGVRSTGVLVDVVYLDVPARKHLRRGDVILSAAGRIVKTPSQLRAAVRTVEPGDPILLTIRRGDKTSDVTVKTIPSPDDATRPLIGVQIGQAADITLPVQVTIDLGEVGGPSAGLPLALEVTKELGRDIDRGRLVVATGEIELDGSINAVGGIKQKTFGARAVGADVLLVPVDNAEQARAYAGNLRVIAVENFQQALRELATLDEK